MIVDVVATSEDAKLSRSYVTDELFEYWETFRGRKSERFGRVGDVMRDPEPAEALPAGVIGLACGRIDRGRVPLRLLVPSYAVCGVRGLLDGFEGNGCCISKRYFIEILTVVVGSVARCPWHAPSFLIQNAEGFVDTGVCVQVSLVHTSHVERIGAPVVGYPSLESKAKSRIGLLLYTF